MGKDNAKNYNIKCYDFMIQIYVIYVMIQIRFLCLKSYLNLLLYRDSYDIIVPMTYIN